LNLLSALEEIKSNIEESEEDHTIQYRFFNEFREAEKWVSSKTSKSNVNGWFKSYLRVMSLIIIIN
jgi:hypothetical protein